jgi:hypothetical protein
VQCGFNDFDVNISAQMRLPVAPSRGQWGPIHVASAALGGNPPAICANKNRIEVVMKGTPDSDRFYQRILANEQEHVADLVAASNQHLVPYYREVMALRGSGADLNACVTNLMTQWGNLPDARIRSFHAMVGADIARRDVPGGHPTRARTQISPTCDRMDITISPIPAPARRAP